MATFNEYLPQMNCGEQYNFDPVALENGDLRQLSLFKYSSNPSLYVEWVPDGLTTEIATNIFSNMGEVTGIDFVNKRTGKARMMFVHFSSFNEREINGFYEISRITSSHPVPYSIPIHFDNRNTYFLRCRINTKPIKRVEYNNAQLSDMVDRLRKELEELKLQVASK